VGEVIEVPGLTEADLRAIVINQITELCDPLMPLDLDEVTVGDMAIAWGRPRASTKAALDQQVASGKMTKRKAYDPRTGRECQAYRMAP
jgi:hypothetical protein